MTNSIVMKSIFDQRLIDLKHRYDSLVSTPNSIMPNLNGVYQRYQNPVLTASHIPLSWRFDLNPSTNPHLMERVGINAVFNAGAIQLDSTYYLIARVEANDRKSFFAVAESSSPTHGFTFKQPPILLEQTNLPDVNVYDMRLTKHEDGWIYGIFCTERKDPSADSFDTSSAVAQAGIVRTKNLKDWERLPDLISPSEQQRNVVLHPEFVQGKYALYTRPQDGFIETGRGGGIGWALCDSMEAACVTEELVMEPREYHTIKEVKNGQGPAPLRCEHGWLHLAHGVRNTAAGLRYVLYMFMTDLDEPWKVIKRPSGYFLAPEGTERVGDVSNVVFTNGWIKDSDGSVYIYYASSDTRMHVAKTTMDQLVDYTLNTPVDGLTSRSTVEAIHSLIHANKGYNGV